ncbi:hypothetical protein [Dictyobacter kobayashii]|uniref:hypothetical protein n=1 Tax=Dictyobacter kobayashii TaxID=2014872 RepID=UPI0013868993|nr:hypothetical protein [Dictyobacter kobayashii]
MQKEQPSQPLSSETDQPPRDSEMEAAPLPPQMKRPRGSHNPGASSAQCALALQ